MPREIRNATLAQCQDVALAIQHLKAARKLLRKADCPQALRKASRALKSTEGAHRHALHRLNRSLTR